MAGEGGVDEGLADYFAPSGHAHLRILRRNVCRSGLVPAVGAGIHVAEVKDFIDALQLRPAHGLVVVGEILAELHCRLQALSLSRVYPEGARAAEHADAPLLQDLRCHVGIDVPGNGPMIAWRISSGLMATRAPRFSKGRSPGFKEMAIVWGMWAGALK